MYSNQSLGKIKVFLWAGLLCAATSFVTAQQYHWQEIKKEKLAQRMQESMRFAKNSEGE